MTLIQKASTDSIIDSFSKKPGFACGPAEIKQRASSRYQTHSSKLTSLLYKMSKFITLPPLNGVRNIVISTRKGTFGPGGVNKRFSLLKAIGWLSLTLVTLPLILLGILGQLAFRPGRGNDQIRIMDATKSKEMKNYLPPVLKENDPIHLATFNIAALPLPVDAMKDVICSKERAKEFVKWINNQSDDKLPLCLGLQEAYDQDASQVITDGIREKYPYAITSCGWSSIPLLGSNGGIQLHSKVPILSAAYYPFQDLIGFGVRCSARGFLRVELDLGNGRTLIAYVTHTQANTSPKEVAIRKNELELIRRQMELDRKNDQDNGIDREGHYYLMGDLNVANVDDMKVLDSDIYNTEVAKTDEYQNLREPDQVLSQNAFYDPFLDDHHQTTGRRTSGETWFLEEDVKGRGKDAQKVEEATGTFYAGADKAHQGKESYGTPGFYTGPLRAQDNCRLDYILRLAPPTGEENSWKGHAEARHVISPKFDRCAISDHLFFSTIFYPKNTNYFI